ncbi:VWA domain-containing protein [Marinomonas posidonica]|uniref:von Willebrand factor type A n=1 Tax=Marinomonas posidonica (strain CECT 7376 / NCIMB 14433 / IVIA-Po-181) TaxID=491952 RepID=F6CTK2_MARPP|nr:VWA domain-containing protein [Marinomonas posidonica]AEF55117.1 von Willebrand factor type A [Marinomonas posidonica IVIA-Po-181]
MLELVWPWFLIALPVPLLARWLSSAKPNGDVLWWAQSQHFIQHQDKTTTSGQAILGKSFLWLAWLLLVMAISRPTWVGEPTQVTPSGRDLLIALDLSGSMKITDMTLNQQTADRLQAAKEVLADFIKKRRGDRIGIIVFGTKAFLQAPLSFDTKTINQLVQEAQIGFAGQRTAIGDAIGLGIKRLEDKPSDQKVLILMTDGANTAGRVQPSQAAAFAASQDVRIHTIGIGADSMLVRGFFGPKEVNPSSDLDEDLLKDIAKQTGGQYFRAKSTEDLQHIYQQLDEMEPTPSEEVWQRPITTLFHWLALFAILSFTASFALNKRFYFSVRERT